MAWFPQHLTPTIDRIVPSISQLMQVSWIDQSSQELGPQSIYSSGCMRVSPGVSRETCRFVTGAGDFSYLKMLLIPSGRLPAVFSDDTCMDERKRERKKGARGSKERGREQASKQARITFHWHS